MRPVLRDGNEPTVVVASNCSGITTSEAAAGVASVRAAMRRIGCRAVSRRSTKSSTAAAVVRRALDDLNERQRVAVVLNKFEDMNYAEIADVMGLTTKGVKSLLSRARAKLREALQPYIFMDGAPPPDIDDEEHGES